MVNRSFTVRNRDRHYFRAVLRPRAAIYHRIGVLKNPSPMDIKVYSAFWCPDCRIAKRFLAKHNLPFTEIDIETSPGAARRLSSAPASVRFLSLSLTENGCSLTASEKASSTRRWQNASASDTPEN